jgi:tetratricopeptide (TPR) repeat protein
MAIHNRICRAFPALLLLLLIASAALSGQTQTTDITQAKSALLQGRADESASLLKRILAAQPANPLAHQLLCRVYYAQDSADSAIHECELAVSNGPTDSENHMWLGRAYGLKASHVGPFTALGLVKKVRQSFERAVELDPNNVHAFSDLGEFYVGAPGMVGGGLDKAQALANRTQSRFPSQYHRLLSLIAGKRKDIATQEAELKNAVDASKSAAAYIDLASFYQQHDKPDQAVSTIRAAIAADQTKGPSLVDAASILTSAHRSPELAERLLRQYLASPGKTDEAPAFKVHMQLGDLLARRGNAAAAHAEYSAAHALASNYAPAVKALESH